MTTSTTARRWVDDTLFVDPTDPMPRLAGAQCARCGTTTFPAQDGCPSCGNDTMADVVLPTSGTLWAFTVQMFEPKRPYRGVEPFEPYGVGYVDLGAVCVETRLTVHDPHALTLGMPVHLVSITAFRDGDDEVRTFAFAPTTEADA